MVTRSVIKNGKMIKDQTQTVGDSTVKELENMDMQDPKEVVPTVKRVNQSATETKLPINMSI